MDGQAIARGCCRQTAHCDLERPPCRCCEIHSWGASSAGHTALHTLSVCAPLCLITTSCVAIGSLLLAAEPQLERFKSQELGMLCWSFAKLAYMPAAALVRATLPHITAWRAPIAQVGWDRGCLGWVGCGLVQEQVQ